MVGTERTSRGKLTAMTNGVRLDVFLDVACLARTRSQAKELCLGGKVEVNGQRATPHRLVRVGDRLELRGPGGRRRQLIVRELASVHIPKAQARQLFEDLTPADSAEERERRALDRLAQPKPSRRGAGRPAKRERRRLERTRGR